MLISEEDARLLVERGERYSRNAARFPMSWLGYCMICGSGVFYLLGVSTSGYHLPLVFWVIFALWTAAGLALSILLGVWSRCVPAGFGKRWTVMMMLWTFAWILTVSWAATLESRFVLILGVLYVVLAVVGPVWELAAMRSGK
ncbi:hypothetical protein GP475_00030 [Corynebacterium poyangense]|uniref:Uncharacterized protein n=1 Tax=Corynebacterium poyangense TaxID=2684405 RepID=A0A7H0SKX0_9CORY|nr:hypothetical protein [Corynebacterium poyangense]MBZ8177285.1 hypothetical protein [Corynebacterium poyangense]QNQ89195.1 hypothetical protein GP475_00030 [Corynebacterium poyangense]